MRARALTATLAAAALVLTGGAPAADGAQRPSGAVKKSRLVTFDSCRELVGYARRHAPRVEPGYFPGGPFAFDPIAAPSPGTAEGAPATGGPPPAAADGAGGGDSSATNVQEQGVDEPDAVKTERGTIFAIANGDLHAVDARAAQPRLAGTLELGGQGEQLLVNGNRLLVIGTSYVGESEAGQGDFAPVSYDSYRPITILTEVDVSDPSAMRMIRSELVNGRFVSARLTGDTARVVISSPPAAFAPGAPGSLERRVSGWVPKTALIDRRNGRARRGSAVRCGSVRHPRTFAGLDMLTVLTIDMSRGLPAVDADALMTSADTVYASKDSLYVATQRFVPPPATPDLPPPRVTTALHRFDASSPSRTTYRASGEVPGYVLNQWSLSEYRGVLRVATTRDPEWWPGAPAAESESGVTTFAERGGALVPLGAVGGLGRGERIQGVRFVDDTGYVVTFRQTDPLYTVDLSDPSAPRVRGELKILGYSAYLHPLGPGLLLGVGQDATAQGRQLGTQLSVFDVSDPSDPRRVQQRRLDAGSSSSAEFDHHAFLYWAPRRLAVIPLRSYSDPLFLGAAGFTVGADGIEEVGRVEHDWGERETEVERSVVVGDRLFTVSGLGVMASDLGTFADLARAEFPAPDPADDPCARGCVADGPLP